MNKIYSDETSSCISNINILTCHHIFFPSGNENVTRNDVLTLLSHFSTQKGYKKFDNKVTSEQDKEHFLYICIVYHEGNFRKAAYFALICYDNL